MHQSVQDNICAVNVLCSWRVSLSMPEGTTVEPPYSLKQTEEFSLDEVTV
jgi:diacylglycerol kinase (ATP)